MPCKQDWFSFWIDVTTIIALVIALGWLLSSMAREFPAASSHWIVEFDDGSTVTELGYYKISDGGRYEIYNGSSETAMWWTTHTGGDQQRIAPRSMAAVMLRTGQRLFCGWSAEKEAGARWRIARLRSKHL